MMYSDRIVLLVYEVFMEMIRTVGLMIPCKLLFVVGCQRTRGGTSASIFRVEESELGKVASCV
jgi:hypothetical protein